MNKKYVGSGKRNWKKATAIGVLALVATGAFWWIGQGKDKLMVPSYRALRVVDGDTFETTESQLIRLTGVDAPEMGRCGSQEAKEALKKLVMNRNLFIKVILRDSTNRLIGHVYNEKGLVATQMAEMGMVIYTGDGLKDETVRLAVEKAKTEGVGIFGEKCSQQENKVQPKCLIKGNIRYGETDKLYRFPGCGQ